MPVSNGGFVVLTDDDLRKLMRERVVKPEDTLHTVDELVVYYEHY